MLKALDFEEIRLTENNVTLTAKLNAKQEYKRIQTVDIFDELTNFENEDLKKRVTEFLFWCINESGYYC